MDFNPILKRNYLKNVDCKIYEIDGHNIVPARLASDKREYGAMTLRKAFLEELAIRKELSDNFCFYAKNFKNFSNISNWAKASFENHKYDLRPYVYSKEEFEHAKTHDRLWNATHRRRTATREYSGQ